MPNKVNNRHKLSNQPSATLQQQYNEVCFRLGQEIANERRAIDNQSTLKDQQEELEAAFLIAKGREEETAARKARDDKNRTDAALSAQASTQTAESAGAGQQ